MNVVEGGVENPLRGGAEEAESADGADEDPIAATQRAAEEGSFIETAVFFGTAGAALGGRAELASVDVFEAWRRFRGGSGVGVELEVEERAPGEEGAEEGHCGGMRGREDACGSIKLGGAYKVQTCDRARWRKLNAPGSLFSTACLPSSTGTHSLNNHDYRHNALQDLSPQHLHLHQYRPPIPLPLEKTR